jgi:hypothetical protein
LVLSGTEALLSVEEKSPLFTKPASPDETSDGALLAGSLRRLRSGAMMQDVK